MNPMMLMKIKALVEVFQKNHPKIPMFFKAAGQAIDAGTVIEMSITTSEGKNLCTNMRVTEEDLELIQQLKGMK